MNLRRESGGHIPRQFAEFTLSADDGRIRQRSLFPHSGRPFFGAAVEWWPFTRTIVRRRSSYMPSMPETHLRRPFHWPCITSRAVSVAAACHHQFRQRRSSRRHGVSRGDCWGGTDRYVKAAFASATRRFRSCQRSRLSASRLPQRESRPALAELKPDSAMRRCVRSAVSLSTRGSRGGHPAHPDAGW